ncbi:MAG: alpha-xylosidase [Phycisphaerales bacterium]|nr:alpha-xylosidase [Phycisphaerales bacterium]
MNPLIRNWLEFEMPAGQSADNILFCAQRPQEVIAKAGEVRMEVPFQSYRNAGDQLNPDTHQRKHTVIAAAIGDEIVRVTFGDHPVADDSPMLDWHPTLKKSPLTLRTQEDAWLATDERGNVRLRMDRIDPPVRQWNDMMSKPAAAFTVSVLPDGRVDVPFMSWDIFSPGQFNSFPLAYVEQGGRRTCSMFSLHAQADECFAGTGERFAKMDLSGRTIDLQNADALGVNNRRAYKNIPFYISSRGYGLLILTSAHARVSLADLSTRAAMGLVRQDTLDLFFIGGGSIERILYNYRRLTGFPHDVPAWSYGTWMGRMTYASAAEVTQAATRLREERFPCDVMHIDTGWFKEDWACDWQFCNDKFPQDQQFIASLRDLGYRVSLWQLPKVSVKTALFEEAAAQGVLATRPEDADNAGGSNFSTQRYAGSIDLTNPRAVEWYQSRLRELFDKGVAAIKADFGEEIDMNARYHAGTPELLHNMYALLYQKLIHEATQQSRDGNAVIWARAGWIGCQRYPIHWAGDAASTWDGLAASIRGGLHLGLSGFGFWSHDIPGFHGVPDFMNTWPSDELYVRWTQAAVFGSHLRYHGAQPREPYEYPRVSGIVRQWLRLRYALIPYLVEQGHKTCQSGYPLLRAMILHHQDDPVCWHIDDQFFCGDDLLVAPILNSQGIRNVYLPAGKWTDLWTGESIEGPRWLHNVKCPLERIPVYARSGSVISINPLHVMCTDEMDWNAVQSLHFNEEYKGITRSRQIGKQSSWGITL